MQTKNAVVSATEEAVPDIIPEADKIKMSPNPTKGSITLEFNTMLDGKATIDLFNRQGKLIWNIFNGDVMSGELKTVIVKKTLSSGTYIYQMNAAESVKTGKPIILQ